MILSILNNKGGVGKTTTAVHVGYTLAQQGKKVLCVDIDTQANLLQHIFPSNRLRSLKAEQAEQAAPLSVVRHNSGMDVLPLSFWSASCADYADVIRSTAQEYDITLIDCPPSLEERTQAAIEACTKILIPTQPELLSVQGLVNLVNLAHEREREIFGIFVTFFDRKTSAHNILLPQIAGNFADWYIDSTINRSNIFSSSSAMHKVGYEWNGRKKLPPALEAYSTLATRIAEAA